MSERIIEGVRLTSPDKILWPDQGTTKSELAEHYRAVADRMLPHVARRPVTMVRCPVGAEKKCFYQRHAGSGVPAELGSRIFERAISGRNSTGIGLAVARDLAEADGGRLEMLQAKPPVFGLCLSRTPPRKDPGEEPPRPVR